MKSIYLLTTLLFLLNLDSFSQSAQTDINRINALNESAYKARLTNPDLSYKNSNEALILSKKNNYVKGIAESYRIRGISKYYQNQSDSAIQNYLTSINYFKQLKDQAGEAKVLNNIGTLYRDVDYDKALEFYNKSLEIAEKLEITDLTTGLNLNIGVIYQKKKEFKKALISFNKSYVQFQKQKNSTGLALSLQNMSVVYKYLNQLDTAEAFAKEAIVIAKENDLKYVVAGTNLTLSYVYISKGKYDEAARSINEGVSYAKEIKDKRLEYDFLYNSYTLENYRKNYQKALGYLQQIYRQDSLVYKNIVSDRISLQQEQFNQLQKQRENELTIQKQKTNQVIFWSAVVVSGLLFVVILLLVGNVNKKAKTNKELTRLNHEISLQKENLDRINHNLEDIIDERTKDLRIKNHKLSQYSSHLSHQIRGPVSTIKGLVNLQKEDLIEKEEFVQQLDKCIVDIDNKILNINEMLHNPQLLGFKDEEDEA
ncbi:tetratricopeptide repeat protein [Pedobacter sp. HMF7647]|uniref:histidine kinase n=1 Tax=Hufsiella arboris TaxID=2695275 RepID=A0A7K1YFT4_9SPHI|nr:tetratricopeptide repeat protein [Hufsiella arboris]MXV53291.1 tetratricopeptide repeat protein [Hufsiella arboris]